MKNELILFVSFPEDHKGWSAFPWVHDNGRGGWEIIFWMCSCDDYQDHSLQCIAICVHDNVLMW